MQENKKITIETYEYNYKLCSNALIEAVELIANIKSEIALNNDLKLFGCIPDNEADKNIENLQSLLQQTIVKRDEIRKKKSEVQIIINNLKNEIN